MMSNTHPVAWRLAPVRQAVVVAMLGASAVASATPATEHWSVTDLGTPAGAASYGMGINDAGQVTGYYNTVSGTQGFVYTGGALRLLADPGGGSSKGFAIASGGIVVGQAQAASGDWVAMRNLANGDLRPYALNTSTSNAVAYGFSNQLAVGSFVDASGVTHAWAGPHQSAYGLGSPLGVSAIGQVDNSAAYAINGGGQITGYATMANGEQHAFLAQRASNSSYLQVNQDLGTLGGQGSAGRAINDAGTVVGYSNLAGNAAVHAFVNPLGGAMADLGTLGGAQSFAYAINAGGMIAGRADTADGAAHAFLYANGHMLDTNGLAGVTGSGWTLTEGRGLNNANQLTGYGVSSGGVERAFVLTQDTSVWGWAASANLADAGGWSSGLAPGSFTAAYVEATSPGRYATLSNASLAVKSLTVGGLAEDTSSTTYLILGDSAHITTTDGVTFRSRATVQVSVGASLTGGPVLNQGVVNLRGTLSTTTMTNQGSIQGYGGVSGNLVNEAGGKILQRTAGQGMQFANVSNSGLIEVRNGEVSVTKLVNQAGGVLLMGNGRLVAAGSGTTIENHGLVHVDSAGATVSANVLNASGAKIQLDAGTNTVFFGSVDAQSGGELFVASGASAYFLGQVQQRSGALFSGTGSKYYGAGFSLGASPGQGQDAGDVAFGGGNTYVAEIGGTTAGTGYDAYNVAGLLTLGGTLKLSSWQGFVAQSGQRFDLFDWGSAAGRFTSIDASGLVLAPDTVLDTSRLYVDGSVAVLAVPEAGSASMMVFGLGLLALMHGRRATRQRA